MKSKLLVGLASALALAACGQSDDADATAEDTAATEAATPATPAAPAPQAFVDTVAASDMFEIEAAKLAQDMGTSDKIKAFAAMMIKDHTASSAKLKDAAGQVEGVTVAPALTAKQQMDLDTLKDAGDQFDALYAQRQVAAHNEALTLLKGYADNGTAEPLKGFASEAVPVVEHHLMEAQQLP
jgi:putative membrane protein